MMLFRVGGLHDGGGHEGNISLQRRKKLSPHSRKARVRGRRRGDPERKKNSFFYTRGRGIRGVIEAPRSKETTDGIKGGHLHLHHHFAPWKNR